MNKKYLIQSLKVVFLGVILAAGISFAQTWTGPGCAAPGCNTPAPINVSSVAQQKIGNLTVGENSNPGTDMMLVEGLETIFGNSFLLGDVRIGEDGIMGPPVAADLNVVNGDLAIKNLSGSGNAYACLDSTGKIFRSDTACVSVAGGSEVHNSGSGQFSVPAGVTSITVKLYGGGGGGAGGINNSGAGPHLYGGGGGGAGYVNMTLAVTGGQTFNWSVGNGGNAGVSSQNGTPTETDGGNGGNTTFGAYFANGGKGGNVGSSGGAGGTYNNGGQGTGGNGQNGANGFACAPGNCQTAIGGTSGAGGTFPAKGAGGDGATLLTTTSTQDAMPGAGGQVNITW